MFATSLRNTYAQKSQPQITHHSDASASFKCRARYHMNQMEYSLYDLALGWTMQKDADGNLLKERKPLFFDGPKMAKQFREGSKNNMYKLEKALVKMGWFVLVADKARRSNGHWSSRTYRVLTHEEWTGACPELDSEGVVKAVKSKPVSHKRTVKSQSPIEAQPVSHYNPASLPLKPSQSPIREKACISSSVETKHVEASGSPAPLFSNSQSPGRVPVRRAAGNVPPVSHQGTVTNPVSHRGTVVWQGMDKGYTDSITGQKLDWADISERIAPNVYKNCEFYDPQGNKISLEQAQEKVLVTA